MHLPCDNRYKFLLCSYERSYCESVRAKDSGWVFARNLNTHPADITRHWTWPHAWNFLIYSRNLRFWSLLTLRGRCHWNIVVLRRLLVLLPGDISFNAMHRADALLSNERFRNERVEREEKSRINNITYVLYVGNISNSFNVTEIFEILNCVIRIYSHCNLHLMNSDVRPLSVCIILFHEGLITE